MSEEHKAGLRGACGAAGKHLGPFDPEDDNDCWGCSSGHVEEFGECIGIVIEQTRWSDVASGPEWDVRWQPSNLRYAYHPDHLIIVE